MNCCRIWLQLKVPARSMTTPGVRDNILGGTLHMLTTGRASGVAVANALAKYHYRRGEILRQMTKEGTNPDRLVHLQEHDRKQYVSFAAPRRYRRFLVCNLTSSIHCQQVDSDYSGLYRPSKLIQYAYRQVGEAQGALCSRSCRRRRLVGTVQLIAALLQFA